MQKNQLKDKFAQALELLLASLREDSAVQAVILCGSLAYDQVWEGSDIDLVIVTIDDRKIPSGMKSLYSHDVNVHAVLIPRTDFRKTIEGNLDNSFMLSLLSHGQLLYATDPIIAELLSQVTRTGERDTRIQLLAAAASALAPFYKARKWLVTRKDLDYAALWLLFTANQLARIEVLTARQVADREVLIQALSLNPTFFKLIYTDLLNRRKTAAAIETALEAIDEYLLSKCRTLFQPLFEYLADASEIRSAIDIEDFFKRNYGIEGLTIVCEFLADKGLIGKAAVAGRLTPKSTGPIEELAFFALADR